MGRYYIQQRYPGSFVIPGRVERQTVEEALKVLWRAATRDPYHGDMAQLFECRLVLERALGLEGEK